MKKIYAFLIAAICCFFTQNSFAQNGAIPNAGFENWSKLDPSLPEMPNGWVTEDLIYAAFFEANTKTTIKTNDKKSGAAAILIKTDTATISFVGLGSIKDTLAGGAVLGNFLTQQAGMPLKTRPAGVSGFYKFKNPDKDTATIAVGASKYNTATKKSTEVGGGELLFKAAAAYTAFNVPIKYTPGTTGMDTLNIYISCGSDVIKSTKSELTIDDLGLTWAVGTSEFEDVPVSIYPNPAFEYAYFDFKAVPQANKIELIDMNGRSVHLENINNSLFQLSLNDFTTGTYFYKVSDAENKVIKTGKIEVLK